MLDEFVEWLRLRQVRSPPQPDLAEKSCIESPISSSTLGAQCGEEFAETESEMGCDAMGWEC